MSAPTIAEALARPRNAFTGVRLALALAVVVSHSVSVVNGAAADEPLARATGYTLGEHAVNGFFAVSGFLVTASFDRRSVRDYVIARLLRIVPGLVGATLLLALVLGALMTSRPLAGYYTSPELWQFIRVTLTELKSSTTLPDVFAANPFTTVLPTVWTLKYEMICYLGVLVVGLAGLLRRSWPVLLIVGALALALVVVEAFSHGVPKGTETALRLPLIFWGGAALYVWRDRVRLSALPLLALAGALLIKDTLLYRTVLFLSEGYATIWLAFAPALARPWCDPTADLSYGVYLYGWPMQQTLRALWPQLSPLGLLGPSILLALAAATLSWYAIEKPALALKSRALGRRTLGTIEPAGP